MSEFQKELEQLINRHSVENQSGTPDFILAEYLCDCLNSFARAVGERDAWYGFRPLGSGGPEEEIKGDQQ